MFHAGLLARRRHRNAVASLGPLGAAIYLGFLVLMLGVIFYGLICQLMGAHFENQYQKYSPYAASFPANGGCEEDRWMAANFKAIDLLYSWNIADKIRYWNKDLLSEQPPCRTGG